MPAAFNRCVSQGGRVRRVSGPSKDHGVKAGEYVNFCYLKGKSYRGEVKTKKGVIEDMDFKKFVPITKIDEEKRMVYGWASTPDLDSQGQIVSVDAINKALPAYMKFPAIREMHQPKAAGVTKQAKTSDKGFFIGAKIVANGAWDLVKENVYRGFSIGGKIKQQVDNVITDLILSEISLVDVPANRNTVFTLVKREDGNLVDMQKDIHSAARMVELAEAVSYRINRDIARGKDVANLEEVLKKLKAVIAKDVKEKEDRGMAVEMAGKSDKPEWVEQHQGMINKYTISSLRKGVNEMSKQKVKEVEAVKEKVVEEVKEKVTEETPQAPEGAPESSDVPSGVEETTEETTETTEVSEGSPQEGDGSTVIDEVLQVSEKNTDIAKRLEKLEAEVVTPKATKEEVAFNKVVAHFDNRIATVTSILEGLKERLEKVEAVAAPVKAKPSYLVEKGGSGDNAGRKAEVEKELEKLDSIRDTDLARYQREGMSEKAFKLMDELRTFA